MSQPTQGAMFDTPCSLAECKRVARPGGFLCQPHWTSVPDQLRMKLALAHQEIVKAKSDRAKADAHRKYDKARQACVQAVAK